jgi:lipase
MTAAIQFEDIAIRQEGEGTPVIALHGTASDSQQWRSLTGWLSGRYRVIAPDLPGYGGSRAAGRGRVLTLHDIAASLRPLITAGTPVHLVGHSFGGAVALKAACLFPGHVRSLTLIEPAAFGALWSERGNSGQDSDALRTAARNSRVALAEGDAWEAMRHIIDFWNGEDAWERTSFRLRQILAAQVAQAHRDFDALEGDVTTAMDLAGVVCPSLSLRGTRSPQVTAAIAEHLRRRLPFVRHEEIEGAGHMLPLTDPHIVDPMIGNFLARVDLGWQDNIGSRALAA